MKRRVSGALFFSFFCAAACGEDRGGGGGGDDGSSCCECLADKNCLPAGAGDADMCMSDAESGTIEVVDRDCVINDCLSACLPALDSGLRIESDFMVASGQGGHAYFAHTSQIGGPTWFEAQDRCRAQRGHLATIGSAAEERLIEGLLIGNSQSWIGLSDSASEGVFQWVDNTRFEFERFEPGQPDDGQSTFDKVSEDCVNIVHLVNVWVDDTCDGTQGSWVCEVD